MFTMKLPRLLLLLLLLLGCAFSSHSLYFSLSLFLYFSLSLSLVNVVPFFSFISKNSLSVFVTVILDGIFSRETRVCARIHAFLSLSSLQIHRVRMYRGWT